ncbi:hypothetical protein LTR66_014124, partial [Elasticomyces elasticus]
MIRQVAYTPQSYEFPNSAPPEINTIFDQARSYVSSPVRRKSMQNPGLPNPDPLRAQRRTLFWLRQGRPQRERSVADATAEEYHYQQIAQDPVCGQTFYITCNVCQADIEALARQTERAQRPGADDTYIMLGSGGSRVSTLPGYDYDLPGYDYDPPGSPPSYASRQNT